MTMFNRLPIGATKPLLVVLVLLGLAATPARAAMAIQEVKGSSGIKAWLVEDYSVPIVTIRFAFRGGSTQDPSGNEGLVNLMTQLFDEGAGDLDSEAFQERLDDAGADMRFDAERDALYGSMRVVADQKDVAFDLLRLAVEQPRFDQAPVDRIRAQIVSGIMAEAKDPEAVAQVAWRKALYGDHPYSRRNEGTEQTLAAVATSDLKALHKRLFARSNLAIAVAGAIDASALKRDLDRIFGGLPAEPSLMPIADTAPKLAQEIRVPYDLPQSRLRLAYSAISDKEPQFFAAYLMNHILGGGAFTSRLWNEVREKRGLAYGIRSSLVNNDHASALVIDTGTRPDRAAETLSLIRAEARRMAAEGVNQEELEAAKKNVIGGYAIDNLNSSSAIANTLVGIQMKDLGIDYIARRKQLIEAVTVEDVRSVARQLLSADPAVMIVGPPLKERKE
ncbi:MULTISPECIES: M16 family metallopeptidase [Rhizobium]|uniref:Zn-dependent peptidase M16 family protein n=3 Tax=Rhizobium TaxID=379 RepID=A0A0B4X964_9HYPH|nr:MULTISPECIES: pitrilysin family protein [Rhizobium]AJD43686.1 Zn-dependent peptidase M16 family protein [Rhizobium gallicum bv. gallicum R602sp]MBB4276514.1 zinc protease [Rhizobium mongolense]TCU33041.1 zinc protease [Rhizobium azibense]TDW34171.1 zinc protease [Rhizobium azibense]